MRNKQLYRSRKNSMLAGVCGGIGEYLEIDPTIVRILFVIGMFTVGFGVLAYIVAIFLMPMEPLTPLNGEDGAHDYTVNEGDNRRYNAPVSADNTRLIIGLFLIAIGGLTIVQRIFKWFDYSLLWPIVIIVIGALMLFKSKKY